MELVRYEILSPPGYQLFFRSSHLISHLFTLYQTFVLIRWHKSLWLRIKLSNDHTDPRARRVVPGAWRLSLSGHHEFSWSTNFSRIGWIASWITPSFHRHFEGNNRIMRPCRDPWSFRTIIALIDLPFRSISHTWQPPSSLFILFS